MTGSAGVGVFGGTFDPIHLGHLAAAEDARIQLGLERILFVPNHVPPHKPDQILSRPEDRARMVELAIEDNSCFELSAVELERPGPSYTLDTMRHLRGRLGDGSRLLFLSGLDSLLTFHTWHEPDALLDEFELAFLARPIDRAVEWRKIERRFPGIRNRVHLVEIPQLDISSHDLRRRVREGLNIRYYVPLPVEGYIREHGLYLETRAGPR
jgi:nicotinate-nucleotide adenylyltransferase